MSLNDLRITEVMYNPAPDAYEFIEITNTGDSAVSSLDFFVGNADFLPEYYDSFLLDGVTIPAGATIVLVPVVPDFSGEVFEPPAPLSQTDFEAAYGELPSGAVYLSYVWFFGGDSLASGESYTLGNVELAIDSVFIPSGAPEGSSVSISLEDGSTTFGEPTPGSTGEPSEGEEITGTDSNEELVGSEGADTIDGNDGNDVINGLGGDDIIDGGRHLDTIDGGAGNDEIYGGSAADDIAGGVGNDEIFGGSGGDLIAGGDGSDMIFGDHGSDDLFGGEGDDEIFGGRSNDDIFGGDDDDILDGGRGNDVLNGEDGNDSLYGGSQSDTLFGGAGDDLIEGGKSDDVLEGGAGADTFVFAGTTNRDVITDFEVGVDQIDITALGPLTDAEILAMISGTDDAVIHFGASGAVQLNGVAAADLQLFDFVYIPDDIFIVS